MKGYFVRFLGRLISKLNRLHVGLTTGVFPRIDISSGSRPAIIQGALVTCDINSPQTASLIPKDSILEGRIVSASIEVHGELCGLAIADELSVQGVFHANKNSIARKVEFLPGSRVTGELIYDPDFLVIHPGAYVNVTLIPNKNIDLARYGIIKVQLAASAQPDVSLPTVPASEGAGGAGEDLRFTELMDEAVPGFSGGDWKKGGPGEPGPAFPGVEGELGDLGEAPDELNQEPPIVKS